MLRNRNANNLLEELEGRRMAVRHAQSIGLPASYANFHRNQIRAIESELAKRWRAQAVARNEPRRRNHAARVIQERFRARRQAPLNNLRTQLNKLRTARDTGNRGNMVNIYYSMGNKWTSVPNGRAAAAVMNNAQRIMSRAGLI